MCALAQKGTLGVELPSSVFIINKMCWLMLFALLKSFIKTKSSIGALFERFDHEQKLAG